MSKSILIIDTPKSCADCRLKRGLFCGESGNSLYDYIHYDDSINDKPSWCPLKPMPQLEDVEDLTDMYDVAFASGWNSCISDMLDKNEYELMVKEKNVGEAK